MVMCAISGCNNNNNKRLKRNQMDREKTIMFHTFPKDEELCKKWVSQCFRNENFNPKTSRVCCLHFRDDHYIRDLRSELLNIKPVRKLKSDAYPTENLPQSVIQNSSCAEKVARKKGKISQKMVQGNFKMKIRTPEFVSVNMDPEENLSNTNELASNEIKIEPTDSFSENEVKFDDFVNTKDDIKYKNLHSEIEIDHCNIKYENFDIVETSIVQHSVADPIQIETDISSTLKNGSEHLKSNKCSQESDKFKCGICFKTFLYSYNLKKHKIIHSGEKPFKCNICFKTCTYSHNLKIHERIHSGEKPYECHICLQTFNQLSTLNIHTKIHTSKKPYQCKICFKTFTLSQNLKIHERLHFKQKLFKCQICLKKFTRRIGLTRHERIHFGEKPYECNICFKTFIQPSSLKRHERIHFENLKIKTS